MNKILVAVFDTEKNAAEGLAALKDLHRDGDITLYASSVVAKSAGGEVSVKHAADSGPLAALVGTVAGGLVGLIAGPGGAVVGAYLGGTGGLLYDLFRAGVDVDFMDEVAGELTPGKVALVADVDESWIAPVDTRLGALGAVTFRRYPDEVLDEQLLREAQAAEADMEQLGAELERAEGEARVSMHAQIALQRTRIQATIGRIDKQLAKDDAELDARVATLQAQLGAARSEQRGRIEARIAEAKASYKARQERLEEARHHARQALELTGAALRA